MEKEHTGMFYPNIRDMSLGGPYALYMCMVCSTSAVYHGRELAHQSKTESGQALFGCGLS